MPHPQGTSAVINIKYKRQLDLVKVQRAGKSGASRRGYTKRLKLILLGVKRD